MDHKNLDLSPLEKSLEHKINDRDLFLLALTHRSAAQSKSHKKNHNNERLEFLGDRVLNFTIADLLFNKFPDQPEGFLTKMHAALVEQSTLAKIAKRIKLNEMIKLGKGEMLTGGYEKPSILSDTMEAVLAALYIDSSLEHAQKIIIKYWSEWIEKVEIENPKSQLQQILQRNELNMSKKATGMPLYSVVEESGPPHEKIYTIKVSTSDNQYSAVGSGSSKQKAQQNAAKALIEELNKKYKESN